MGITASSETAAGAVLDHAAAVRAYLFEGGAPRVFTGKIDQLHGATELVYKVTRELPEAHAALAKRRTELGMDEDSEGVLLHLEALATVRQAGLEDFALVDEKMVVTVDRFGGETRVHCRSPTNADLGGVVLVVKEADFAEKRKQLLALASPRRKEVEKVSDEAAPPRPAAPAAFSLVGGDEYWWVGYPPIINVKPEAPAGAAPAPEPEEPHFMGSFFEKDIAVQGLQGV